MPNTARFTNLFLNGHFFNGNNGVVTKILMTLAKTTLCQKIVLALKINRTFYLFIKTDSALGMRQNF